MTDVQKSIQVFPFWRICFCGLLVVGFCSILCWGFGWCWWSRPCPDCPDVDCCGGGEFAAQIVVEDMHAGVWMVADNTSLFEESDPAFVCSESDPERRWGKCAPPFDTNYRHGVLFQMGSTELVPGEDPPSTAVLSSTLAASAATTSTNFYGVYIKHSGGETTLIPGVSDEAFDWLDVREPDTPCVIDPLNAYAMFNNATGVTTECGSLPTTNPEYNCSRNRSLHSSLEAHYLITYWAGAGFYGMDSAVTDELEPPDATHAGEHVSYEFRLPKKVTVDRWRGGCYEGTYTDVTEIRIMYQKGSALHEGYPHTPMDGGKKIPPP